MLLRRLTQHVKEQNWFAVFLDLLIVISGIFIGLQVSAWNDARADRVLERQYLERLLADMEGSVTDQLTQFEEEEAGQMVIDRFAALLKANERGEEASRLATATLNYLGWQFQPPTNLVTVRELQSTGNIGLIRSVDIRQAIGQLQVSHEMARYSAEQTSAVQVAAEEFTMDWSYSEPDPDGRWGYAITPDLDRIYASRSPENVLSWFSSWSKYHLTWLNAHHEDTIALRDLLKAALDNKP